MSDSDIEWVIDLGDSEALQLRWRNADGTIANMTGWTHEIFGAHTSLVGQLTVTWVDITTGLLRVEVKSLKDIPPRVSLPFRIALIPPGGDRTKDRTFPRIRLVAQ